MCAIFLIAIEARNRVIALHPRSAREQISRDKQESMKDKNTCDLCLDLAHLCTFPIFDVSQGLGPDLQRMNSCKSRQEVASHTGVRIRVRARCSVPLLRFHGHGAATRTTRVQSQGGSTRDGASKPMLNPNTQCIINAASWPRHTRWRIATS